MGLNEACDQSNIDRRLFATYCYDAPDQTGRAARNPKQDRYKGCAINIIIIVGLDEERREANVIKLEERQSICA